ncbi:co-chaperone GroES [Candidatus Dojkabacteria bacterium]|uniref:Co-chaperonin GroES n=1 Tax=Candidatus Dojkabacteria bacterium TaxID=2099670 RepID=A0A847VE11_9BACT|nr:co-chaperone GroES [Candidatus Dojkabacteria bacterium]
MNIQPLGNRVLVKPQEIEEKTPGGLVIPPSASDEKKPSFGTVIKLGKGKDKEGKVLKFDVKVGDLIYFKKYSPEEIEVNEEEVYILDAEDILAIAK